MNRAQKFVLVVYVLVVLALGFLWVPWKYVPWGPRGLSTPSGHGPVELAAVTLAAGGLVLVFQDR